VVLWALGVIGDLLAAQRVMTQKTFERVRRIELQLGVAPSHYEPGTAGRGEPAPVSAGAQARPGRFARTARSPGSGGRSPEAERPRVGAAADAERSRGGSAPEAERSRAGSAPETPEEVRL
jgi:hypothetical protein